MISAYPIGWALLQLGENMYLRENEYEQLCKTCPFLRKGYTNVCGYGVGCHKQDKLEEIKEARK